MTRTNQSHKRSKKKKSKSKRRHHHRHDGSDNDSNVNVKSSSSSAAASSRIQNESLPEGKVNATNNSNDDVPKTEKQQRPDDTETHTSNTASSPKRTDEKRKKKKRKRQAQGATTVTKNIDGTAEDHSSDHKRPPVVKKLKRNETTATFTAAATTAADYSDASKAPNEQAVDKRKKFDFPYVTDADDHCESPKEAYEDIASLLREAVNTTSLSKNHRDDKDPSITIIYDPYYCDGAVIQNLKEFGFDHVYNRKEDCYAVWDRTKGSSLSPHFDVLVTNPPYSSDHIERLMRYVTSKPFGTRPWFLLMPNWVVKKDYYQTCTSSIRPFYVVPKKRYVYLPPKDFRESKKSDVHKKSSPFVSMWYIWGGTPSLNDQLIRCFYQHQQQSNNNGIIKCDLARSKSALRDLRRKNK